jgi:hypothetical protein
MKTSATAHDYKKQAPMWMKFEVTSSDYDNGTIFKILFKDYTRVMLDDYMRK